MNFSGSAMPELIALVAGGLHAFAGVDNITGTKPAGVVMRRVVPRASVKVWVEAEEGIEARGIKA